MPLSFGPISIGELVGKRYRVDTLLGQGGMAVVYRATHAQTGKPCALKLVHPHLVARPELVDLFVKEARVGGRIGDNPYIVNVFDAGVDELRGVPFIAMELLQGETLEEVVQRGGGLLPPLVVTLIEQLADALDQAHRAGIVHRDLKPSNLFLTRDRRGQPVLKVMDFGIAKVIESEAQRTATQIGTPAYAAPEQMGATLRKVAAKQGITVATGVSPATDVWALGLIAYELLTGHPTGQFWDVETLAELPTKVVLIDIERPSQRAGSRAGLLPTGFDDWFARCLKKNAAERWRTVGEASAALVRLLQPGAAPPIASPPQPQSGGPIVEVAPIVGSGGPTRAQQPLAKAQLGQGRAGVGSLVIISAVVVSLGLGGVGVLKMGLSRVEGLHAPDGSPAEGSIDDAGARAPSTEPDTASLPSLDTANAQQTSASPFAATASPVQSGAPAEPSQPRAQPAVVPKPGRLSIICKPYCDEVIVDGRSLGPSPIIDEPVSPGLHQITSKRGSLTKLVTVTVVSGTDGTKILDMKAGAASAPAVSSKVPNERNWRPDAF